MRFSVKSYIINKVMTLLVAVVGCCSTVMAQEKIVNPNISYAGSPRTYINGGISVHGEVG